MWRQFVISWIYCTLISTSVHADATICKSMEITSYSDIDALRNCRIVVGHVRIVNLHLDYEHDILSTDVEEITDYLLVYRSHSLETLHYLFPRLALIRGETLLFDQYALIIYENYHLRDLGLSSLIRIQKGNIRVESNPQLCFVETVNWIYLLRNATTQHFSLRNNRHPNFCPLCDELPFDTTSNQTEPRNKYCWNHSLKQLPPTFSHSMICSDDCHPAMGCVFEKGKCCERNCLSSCTSVACYLCASYRFQGKCVDECFLPNFYLLNKRECVLATTCRQNGMIPHEGVCLEDCPKHYERIKDSNGYVACRLPCRGDFLVQKTEDIVALQDCTVVRGSLTIELSHIETKVTDLEEVLFKIKEITGYLKVTRSPQLVSLNFLRNLETIGGQQVVDNTYALYVVNNAHLEHLWPTNHNVAILSGRIYFHLNPRLCMHRIMKLKPMLKSKDISFADVSPNSNGERVICDKAVRLLNATLEERNATAARIKVDPMPADDKDVLIGYLHHYKEAPVQNVNMYDGRHGCGHDNWLMDISPNRNVRHVITNLKPNTQYAYFVKTMTMTDYHMQIDAYSRIQYFKTLPSKPGAVRKVYYHSASSTEIVLHWWPPRFPNGIIDKYLINYENITDKVNRTSPYDAIKTDTDNGNCQCSLLNPNDSGPMPDDESYYSKEKITYEEAVPNILFVARRSVEKSSKDEEEQKTEKLNVSDNDNDNVKRKPDGGDGNKVEKETKLEFDMKEMEEKYRKFRMEMERKALAEQDTGTADFPIVQPLPLCDKAEASKQYQLYNSCQPREYYPGVSVPGNIHTYTLKGLQPQSAYRIFIRACVKDLVNGCGKVTTIIAETMSRHMDDFFKKLDDATMV